MDYHQNARLTVHSREQRCRKVIVEGLTLKRAAARFNVSAKTAAKWVLGCRVFWGWRSQFTASPTAAADHAGAGGTGRSASS
jgi:hypothetical protein